MEVVLVSGSGRATPPLGLLSLAACLDGHEVRVARLPRMGGDGSREDAIRAAAELAPGRPDVVGFSSMGHTYPWTIALAAACRALLPGATIILGGPKAAACDVATLRLFPSVDAVFRGEAERTLPPWLEAAGRREASPGVTVSRRGEVLRGPDPDPVLDLDALPVPRFDLWAEDDGRPFPLEAGRGCPFSCSYCSTSSFFGRRHRVKSPARILREVRAAGRGDVQFHHDLFTLDRGWVEDLCEALAREKSGLTWRCSTRPDLVDEALLGLMASAGCRAVFFGMESGSPEVLRRAGRGLDPARAWRGLAAAHAAGLECLTSFIAGFPDEDEEELSRTITLMLRAVALGTRSRVQLHLLVPQSGTELLRASPGLERDGFHADFAGEEACAWPFREHPSLFPELHYARTSLSRDALRRLAMLARVVGLYRSSVAAWLEHTRDGTGRALWDALDCYTPPAPRSRWSPVALAAAALRFFTRAAGRGLLPRRVAALARIELWLWLADRAAKRGKRIELTRWLPLGDGGEIALRLRTEGAALRAMAAELPASLVSGGEA